RHLVGVDGGARRVGGDAGRPQGGVREGRGGAVARGDRAAERVRRAVGWDRGGTGGATAHRVHRGVSARGGGGRLCAGVWDVPAGGGAGGDGGVCQLHAAVRRHDRAAPRERGPTPPRR